MRRLLSSMFALILAVQPLALSAESTIDWRDFDGRTQGTSYRIRYLGISEASLAVKVEDRLQSIDRVFSNYRKDSVIERFNVQQTTEWQAVPKELAILSLKALEFSRLTHGAFDITIGQLMKVWGFGPYRGSSKNSRVPNEALIAEALSRSGYQSLEVREDPPALRKLKPELLVDMSGIAQGFTVDQLGELLEKEGVRSYLVEVGGELRGRGRNPEGHAWQVAVENPSINSGLGSIVSLNNISLSTSGNYRDFIDIGNQRFSHIFDPRLGRPIPSEFVSASVMTSDCTVADALAKAFLILSEDDQKTLAAKLDLGIILQKRVGKNFVSRRLGNFEGKAKADAK